MNLKEQDTYNIIKFKGEVVIFNNTKKQYKDFFTRPMNLGKSRYNKQYYNNSITRKRTKNQEKKMYQDLFGKCFSHHIEPKAFKTNVSSKQLIYIGDNEHSKKFFEDDNLSAYFIDKIYEPPKFKNYEAIEDFIEEEKDFQLFSYEEFSKSILLERPFQKFSDDAPKILGSNVVRYLIGDIGKGKSTLATYLYADILKNSHRYDDQLEIIPVYINVDFENETTSRSKPLDPYKYFFKKLYNKTRLEIGDYTKKDDRTIDLNNFTDAKDSNDAIKKLKDLIIFTASLDCRIFYIIDNLDRFHYYHARYAFFEEGSKAIDESIEGLIWIINEFMPSTSESSFGHAGISALFIMREYVYDYMSDSLDVATGRDAPEDEIFELLPVNFQVVLNSRTNLLIRALEQINGMSVQEKKHDIDSFIRINDSLQESKEESVLIQVSRLGHHGYRSLVDFISSLSIDPRDDVLFKRFFENQAHTMILLYIAKLKHKYAQRKDHFPNIFLNDTVISYNAKHNPILEAHKTHKPTYWLKYFILKYIVHNEGASTVNILDDFLPFFPNEEHLIRHILGSLCTANESSCAEVPLEYDTNPDNLHISPTNRAKELYNISSISKRFKDNEATYQLEFCFNYSYLSCIIDDDWMSYPKDLIEKIFNKKLSHRHLLTTGDVYQKTSTEELKERYKSVLVFIKLIRESLDFEINTKKGYENFLKNQELFPNFEDIVNANIILMGKIAKSLSLAGKINFNEEWKSIDENTEISEFYQNFIDNDFYPNIR